METAVAKQGQDRAAGSGNRPRLYGTLFTAALGLLPCLAVLAPRFMGYAPGLLAVVFTGAFLFVFQRRPRLSKTALGWAAAIVALACASSLWALDPEIALERTGKMALVLLPGAWLISLTLALAPETYRDRLWLLPAGFALAALLNVFELYMHGFVYAWLHQSADPAVMRFNLSALNRSAIVTVLGIFIGLAAVRALPASNQAKKAAVLLLTILILAVLFKTASQSAQLAAMIGFLFFLAWPYRLKSATNVLILLISLLVLLAPWLAQGLFKILPQLVENEGWFHRSYALSRSEIWDFTARYALESPFIGHGIEATRMEKHFDSAQLYHPATEVLHPHNFALQIWVEFGLLGALMAAGFLGYLLHSVSRRPPAGRRVCLPVLMAALSAASTSYGLWQGWWLGTFIFLICAVLLTARALESKA